MILQSLLLKYLFETRIKRKRMKKKGRRTKMNKNIYVGKKWLKNSIQLKFVCIAYIRPTSRASIHVNSYPASYYIINVTNKIVIVTVIDGRSWNKNETNKTTPEHG